MVTRAARISFCGGGGVILGPFFVKRQKPFENQTKNIFQTKRGKKQRPGRAVK